MKYLYDSRLSLASCAPLLHRKVGVRVTEPFTHAGFTPPRVVVEIEKEFPILNTYSAVSLAVPVEEWKSESKKMTGAVIASIDALIVELKEHRDRLARESDPNDIGEHKPHNEIPDFYEGYTRVDDERDRSRAGLGPNPQYNKGSQ